MIGQRGHDDHVVAVGPIRRRGYLPRCPFPLDVAVDRVDGQADDLDVAF
jgi:hypothetical protein